MKEEQKKEEAPRAKVPLPLFKVDIPCDERCSLEVRNKSERVREQGNETERKKGSKGVRE